MFIRVLEIIVKIFVCLYLLIMMLVCYSCWHGGHWDGSDEYYFKQKNNENFFSCKIEGKRISKYGENVEVPFWQLFISGFHGIFRIYHILYETESKEKNGFITYKFPLTSGVGAIVEDTDLVIEESFNQITIYYDKAPIDGFLIEKNPFSKNIVFKQKSDLTDIKAKEGSCD